MPNRRVQRTRSRVRLACTRCAGAPLTRVVEAVDLALFRAASLLRLRVQAVRRNHFDGYLTWERFKFRFPMP
jgi:hypothetical protein